MKPASIKVGVKVYRLHYDKKSWKQRVLDQGETRGSEEAVGRTDHIGGNIWIRPGMSAHEEKATLVHEVLHCLWWNVNLPIGGFFKEDMEETEEGIVSALEPRLHAFLVENTGFLSYLTEAP